MKAGARAHHTPSVGLLGRPLVPLQPALNSPARVSSGATYRSDELNSDGCLTPGMDRPNPLLGARPRSNDALDAPVFHGGAYGMTQRSAGSAKLQKTSAERSTEVLDASNYWSPADPVFIDQSGPGQRATPYWRVSRRQRERGFSVNQPG